MVTNITHESERGVWNEKALHPMQSWEWGEARAQMGIEVVRIGEYVDDTLEAVFQMTLHQIPKTRMQIGYVPRSVAPSIAVLQHLLHFAKQRNIVYIKFEPITQVTPSSPLRPSISSLFPRWTQCLDLTKHEDELLKNMKQKTRYNIRLAEKKGVTVQEMTNDKGFEIFSKLYFETTKRQRYAGHNNNYHKTIFNTLKKTQSHILVAEYNGEPIAAYHLLQFHDVLYYIYGGSSDRYREVMGANLIMWEAIRLGKRLGCTSFDLWGSLPPEHDARDVWAGFTRFKSGFGTEFVQRPGSYDLVCNHLLYYPLILAQNVRDRFLGG